MTLNLCIADRGLYFRNLFEKLVECIAILGKISIRLLYLWNTFVSTLLHPQIIELLLKDSSNLDKFPRCQPTLYKNTN